MLIFCWLFRSQIFASCIGLLFSLWCFGVVVCSLPTRSCYSPPLIKTAVLLSNPLGEDSIKQLFSKLVFLLQSCQQNTCEEKRRPTLECLKDGTLGKSLRNNQETKYWLSLEVFSPFICSVSSSSTLTQFSLYFYIFSLLIFLLFGVSSSFILFLFLSSHFFSVFSFQIFNYFILFWLFSLKNTIISTRVTTVELVRSQEGNMDGT